MTIPVPLSLAIRTSRGFRHITDAINDLSYGNASPGGHTECTASLHRPLHLAPGELAQFGEMIVYGPTGVMWEGILQDPGRSSGDGGDVYELAGVGGQTHFQDDTRMLYYVDTDTESWQQTDIFTAGAQIQHLPDINAAGDAALSLRIPQGTNVDGSGAAAVQSRAVAAHRGISEAGQKLAKVAFRWDSGLTSANLTASLYAGTYGLGPADVPWSATFNVAGSGASYIEREVDPGAGSAAWTNGRNWPILRFHFTAGAGTASADTWWLQITDLSVRTMLMNKSGVEITTGYTLRTIYAHEVVADLLGRILTANIDGANAVITATTFPIEHLSYPDGISPAGVMDDLLKFEQGYTWHVWERNPVTGKFRFEFIPWPTAVRYEADVIDGFSAPASGNTIFNRVVVRYHNRGTTRLPLRTSSVPLLTEAGYDRTHFIDLGDEASTQTNAHRVGDQFLEEHQHPVNAGRLVVRRPIIDYQAGRMVMPWELRSGGLIRVRGVESHPDALNADGRDGSTIFKVASVNFSASEAAATLELDSYSPSLARSVADVHRRQVTRRR